MRILLVEDDARMSALVRRGLAEDGHVVHAEKTGEAALGQTLASGWDAVVLDVRLPGIDGVEVVRRLRARGNATPVLMLTARDAATDVVGALDAGADDYLTKPFSFEVLLARLRALTRRAPVDQTARHAVLDLALDTGARTATRGGETLALTRTEFNLLEFLMARSGRVVTRRQLIEQLWGFEREVESNTLDAFVRLLRQKVDRAPWPALIHTVRGVGYVLKADQDP